MLDIKQIEEILVLAAKIGTAVGALALIVKYFSKILAYLKSFFLMPEKIQKIEAETRVNGGSSIRDVLNRIEKRQLLQEHRIIFVFDYIDEFGIFEADPDGNCTRCSLVFAGIFGKTQDELIGNNWINSIFHEDRDEVYHEFSEAIKQKRNFYTRFRIINGQHIFEVDFKIYPVIKDNHVISWMGILKKVN